MEIVSFLSYPQRSNGRTLWSCAGYPLYLIRGLKHKRTDGCPLNRKLRCCCPLGVRTEKEGLAWFGGLGALVLKIKRLQLPLTLVPVPASDCAIGCKNSMPTLRLAEAVARASGRGVTVSDVLRWKHSQTPSHRGGSRDPTLLTEELTFAGPLPATQIVLIDDVVTTGGHLTAAIAKLASVGLTCKLAICLARTESPGQKPLLIKRAVIGRRF